MMMNHDPKLIARAITHLPETLRNCREIAEALIDTNRPIARHTWRSMLGAKTDYEMARQRALDHVGSIIERLQQQSDEQLRPDIIRATAYLGQIAAKCRKCPQTNLRNLAEGRPFVCLAGNQPNSIPRTKFSFRLDSGGRIVESR